MDDVFKVDGWVSGWVDAGWVGRVDGWISDEWMHAAKWMSEEMDKSGMEGCWSSGL